MRRFLAPAVLVLVVATLLVACSSRLGIGLNVGMPLGNHGYISMGTGGWY